MNMKPGDILRVDLKTGISFFWEIGALYLGSEGQESIVDLMAINQNKDYNLPAEARKVPLQLLEKAIERGAVNIYETPHGD